MSKNKSLKELVSENITPLITCDYIFLDLPYYTNIGDTLIWKGTEELLKAVPHKCIYRSAIETYQKPSISEDIVILLQGGGNFGDIWRRHTDFVLKILEDFPNNPVVILPQTIYYKSHEIMIQDAQAMAQHNKLTICARDNVTYELLTKYFCKNTIIKVPDMAFCISKDFLQKHTQNETENVLFFKRKDQESAEYDFSNLIAHSNVEQREWPSMDFTLFSSKIMDFLKRAHVVCVRRKMFFQITAQITDFYAQKIYMPHLLKVGISFISKYNYIYTTRLHGAILSILLDKPIMFFDNSYGKNSGFYHTWLQDFEKISFIQKDNNK